MTLLPDLRGFLKDDARLSRAFLVLSGLLAVVMWAAFRTHYQLGMFNDDAYYYLYAKAIFQNVIHANWSVVSNLPPIHYPLGLPIVLSPLVGLLPNQLLPLQLIPLGLLLVSLTLANRLFQGEFDALTRGLILLWVALHPVSTRFSVTVMAEVPFLSLVLLCLYLENRPGKYQRVYLCLALAASIWVKMLGLPLLAAIVLSWLVHKRYRDALTVLGGTFLLVLPWLLISALGKEAEFMPGYQSYGTELTDYLKAIQSPGELFQVLLAKGIYYGKAAVFAYLLPISSLQTWEANLPTWALVIFIAIGGLMAVGFVQRWRDKPFRSHELFCVFLITILLFWPNVASRYVMAVMPLFLVYTLNGSLTCFGPQTGKRVALGFLVLSITVSGISQAAWRGSVVPADQKVPLGTLNWVKNHASRDAVFISDIPPLIQLYGERNAFALGWLSNPDILLSIMYKLSADHLLMRPALSLQSRLGGQSAQVARALRISTYRMVRNSPVFELIHENVEEGTLVYRLREPPGDFVQALQISEQASAEIAREGQTTPRAKQLIRQALAVDPRLFEASFHAASIAMQSQDWPTAHRLLRTCRMRWPEVPVSRLNFGKILAIQGHTKAAEAEFDAALKLARETAAGVSEDANTIVHAKALLGKLRAPEPSRPQ